MKKLLTLIAALGVMSMFAISNAQAGGVGGPGFNKAGSYSKMLRHNRHGNRGHHGKKIIIKKVVKVFYKHGKKIIIVKTIKKIKKRRHGHKRHHGKRWLVKGHRAQRPCRPHNYRIVKHKGPKRHKARKGPKGPGGQPQNNRRRT